MSKSLTQPLPTFDAILKLTMTVRYPLHAADIEDAMRQAHTVLPDQILSEHADAQDYACRVVGVEEL